MLEWLGMLLAKNTIKLIFTRDFWNYVKLYFKPEEIRMLNCILKFSPYEIAVFANYSNFLDYDAVATEIPEMLAISRQRELEISQMLVEGKFITEEAVKSHRQFIDSGNFIRQPQKLTYICGKIVRENEDLIIEAFRKTMSEFNTNCILSESEGAS